VVTYEDIFIDVALWYQDLRKEYQPFYSFGSMSRTHRLAKHFMSTAQIICELNTSPQVYLAAQFYTGEVPLPHQLYSGKAIKRYKDFVESRIVVSNPDAYLDTLSRAWNLDKDEVRRTFAQWL